MSHFLNSPVFTGNVTAPTLNNLTLTAIATGFTLAGGTTSKTLQVNKTITLDATSDSLTLNIGGGGTLGSNAFTSTAYQAAGTNLTTFTALANAAGALYNNGSGTLSYITVGGASQADSGAGSNGTGTALALANHVHPTSTAYEAALGNPGTNGFILSSTTLGVRSWISNTGGFANPMTTLGDIMYENATPVAARLAGNTSATMAVLTQTGNGSISAAPVWTLINSNNGICGLDGTGKVALAQLPSSVVGGMNYQGVWNATTNATPTLVNGTGTKGYYYKVGTAGTTNIDGNASWSVGDIIAFNGTTWDQIQGGAADVISVNGNTGVITVAATNQTMFIGTSSVAINATTGTFTTIAGMTSITSTTFVGALTGNASGTSASFTGNLTGDVTSTGMSTSLAATMVTGKVLTNFALGTDSSQLAATDTILAAFQKLQYQGNLDLVNGISTKSATYNPSVVTDKLLLCDATAGAFAVTLLAAPVTGQCMSIKKIDSSANAVTINGNAKTIDGAASVTLPAQWNAITIVYNGTSWYIV